jgi:AraC family transcriptional regulator
VLGTTVFSQRLTGVSISKTVYEPAMVMHTHVHERAYFSFVTEGHYTEHSVDAAPRRLHAGMLVFHPAGEVHADCVHDQSMATINVEFHDQFLPDTFLCVRGEEAEKLTREFLAALPAADGALRRSLATLARFAWALAPRHHPPSALLAARRSLETFDGARPVASVAEELGVHRVRLHRSFKRAFGDSPRAAIGKRRLAEAARRLVESSDSIAQVAATCGFYDQSHFCRQFKLVTGITPSRYRAAFTR